MTELPDKPRLLTLKDTLLALALSATFAIAICFMSMKTEAPPAEHPPRHTGPNGFTLIEMSVVLVIIGLIVGGVLVGQSLISAAQMRATISQIERYNTAATTFYGKYGYLPGDIPAALVTQFGFTAAPGRSGVAGQGDGNGMIVGYNYQTNTIYGIANGIGEQAWFWEDLSTNSGLIEGGFISGNATGLCGLEWSGYGAYTGSQIGWVFPQTSIGSNSFITVNNDGANNYFTVSTISQVGCETGGETSGVGLTVQQAYAVDKKLDDGSPQTGRITARYGNTVMSNVALTWAAGGSVAGTAPGGVATPSATTCYDNGGNSSNPMAYSITQNGGAGVNCALSFRMQAGD